MKNKFRVKNGKCGAIANAFLLVACLAAVQGSVKKERGEGENRADVSADLWRERKVVRARKVLNYALFEAIHRGNFRGVQFLIERGANPQVENKKGQKPLDLAEILAEEFPEEAERLEIVGLLS
ncbi:MAG: ankyrin repeat domain-containing protein, partial [Puniceicoccales bacterium]|nr:ankyrin repeat domain-containing protein [Puniceicoccales bacterium]